MTDDEKANLIVALLNEGVPCGPVARALSIDELLVKEIKSDFRVTNYGSAEISEILQDLMFDAAALAREQLFFGNPSTQSRVMGLLLSRQLAQAARLEPDSFAEMREVLSKLSQGVKAPTPIPDESNPLAFSPLAVEEDLDSDDDL
jgi:hypothetical protein